MEVSGLVSRHIPYLSGAGIDTRSSQPLSSNDVHLSGRNAFGARLRTRRAMSTSGFDDNGHVKFYYSGSRIAGNKKEKEIKKKLKLLKGFAEGLAAQLQENLISEREKALLQQLEQVRAEEKELKKKKKLEKAKIKAELMKTMNDCPSSLSLMLSGESSEIGEGVTDTNNWTSAQLFTVRMWRIRSPARRRRRIHPPDFARPLPTHLSMSAGPPSPARICIFQDSSRLQLAMEVRPAWECAPGGGEKNPVAGNATSAR